MNLVLCVESHHHTHGSLGFLLCYLLGFLQFAFCIQASIYSEKGVSLWLGLLFYMWKYSCSRTISCWDSPLYCLCLFFRDQLIVINVSETSWLYYMNLLLRFLFYFFKLYVSILEGINLFDVGLFPFKGFLHYFDQLHFAEILKFL